MRALGFQTVESTSLSKFWFQMSTCTSTARPFDFVPAYKVSMNAEGPQLRMVRLCKLDPSLKAPPGFKNLIPKKDNSASKLDNLVVF